MQLEITMIGEPEYIREVIRILQDAGVTIDRTLLDPDGSEPSVNVTIQVSGLKPPLS